MYENKWISEEQPHREAQRTSLGEPVGVRLNRFMRKVLSALQHIPIPKQEGAKK